MILSSLWLLDASNEATVFSLKQNFPNPFNGQTNIEFTIQNPNNISIEIFDVNGRIIRTLFDGYHNSGTSILKWDGKNKLNEIVSTGIYFYNIKTENYIKTKKLIFSK